MSMGECCLARMTLEAVKKNPVAARLLELVERQTCNPKLGKSKLAPQIFFFSQIFNVL